MQVSSDTRFGVLTLGTGLVVGLARHVLTMKWAALDWSTFFSLWFIHWIAVYFVVFIVVVLDQYGRRLVLQLPPEKSTSWQTAHYWVCLTLMAAAIGMVIASVWPENTSDYFD